VTLRVKILASMRWAERPTPTTHTSAAASGSPASRGRISRPSPGTTASQVAESATRRRRDRARPDISPRVRLPFPLYSPKRSPFRAAIASVPFWADDAPRARQPADRKAQIDFTGTCQTRTTYPATARRRRWPSRRFANRRSVVQTQASIPVQGPCTRSRMRRQARPRVIGRGARAASSSGHRCRFNWARAEAGGRDRRL
jgi:hypothetical protein